MRLAYLDCFAGVSGDMLLGAMLDAGLPERVLHDTLKALDIGATLRIRKVDRSGIVATKVDVYEGEALAEAAGAVDEQAHREHDHHPATQHEHKGGHTHEHNHAGEEAHSHDGGEAHSHAGGEVHSHSGAEGHADAGGHAHVHGRSLTTIKELIQGTALSEAVKRRAIETFVALGRSEAKIHDVPLEEIHFHEVGAVDAIADIVCACAGFEALEQTAIAETGERLQWHCSSLNVGGGMVKCAHGTFPVPAPATADLLRGMPTYGAHVQMELITPTGAALLRHLNPSFGGQPAMQVTSIGYGAGTRDPKDFPNVVRLMIGDAGPAARREELERAEPAGAEPEGAEPEGTTVAVLETALDDCSPQVVAYVVEQLLAMGALDAMTTPVGMKKGRQGVLLTVLAAPEREAALVGMLLRETTTLGVRCRREQRVCLDREIVSVGTSFGPIRVKVGRSGSDELKAQPEFEDCRAAAKLHQEPVRRVLEAAVAAYAAQR